MSLSMKSLRRMTALAASLAVWAGLLAMAVAGSAHTAAAQTGGTAGPSDAETTTWTVVPQTTGDWGVAFSLGWTLGTHEGHVNGVTGTVRAQLSPLTVTEGEFRIPITAMTTGSTQRDCHMREALGIDYSHSHFPADHVCMNNQLPASGPDSVVYPDVAIKILSLRPQQTGAVLAPTQPLSGDVVLELSIHGVTHEVSAPVRLELVKPNLAQVQTGFELKLADFGIVVKMPPLMSVDDHIKVTLNLHLAPG